MRLIDADALCKDLLERWSVAEARKEELIKAVMADIVTPIIVLQPTIEPEPHWIPCSERLPEPRIDVWCNSDLGEIPGFYDETTETWYRGDYLELLVNAWMPLPSPYQPEEESE